MEADAEVEAPFPRHEHPPVKMSRRRAAKYHLFSAARRGCMQCVRHWVETHADARAWTSDAHGWSAADWAKEAIEEGYADPEALRNVVEYLEEYWRE